MECPCGYYSGDSKLGDDMDFEELQDIKQDLNQKEGIITGGDIANAIVNVAKKPADMLKVAVSDKLASKVKTDQATIERIDKSVDKLVDSGVTAIENEAESEQNKSEKDKLQSYFDKHIEELKTAGIDKPTYLEDMERGVKWHKRWSNFHWVLFGWWLTGIRTFIMRAKPFKTVLNVLAIVLSLAVLIGMGFGIGYLFKLIKF